METDSRLQAWAHPMRRKDRELGREEAESILSRGEYGILCTCGSAGIPYGVPVNYVYEDGCICFHSAAEGHKVQHLQENPYASFTVVGATRVLPQKFSTQYESAIAFGRVTPAEGERKRAILRALAAKYSPEHSRKAADYIARDGARTAVYSLRIEHLCGKAHR